MRQSAETLDDRCHSHLTCISETIIKAGNEDYFRVLVVDVVGEMLEQYRLLFDKCADRGVYMFRVLLIPLPLHYPNSCSSVVRMYSY